MWARSVACVALVVSAAACTSDSSTTPRPASTAPRPTTTIAPELIDAELARLQTHDDPDAPVTGESDSDFHHQQGPSMIEAMTAAEQRAQDEELDAARAFAATHARLRDAIADGYVAQDFVDGDGVHVTDWRLITEHFDAARPSMIIYESRELDAPIVALSYVVESVGAAPNGFTGPNDRWHQHLGLCVRDGRLVREAFKDHVKCDAMRGRYLSGTTLWMLHAWVVEGRSNRWGVFALENPDYEPAVDTQSSAG